MPQTTIFHIPALDCPDELALVERSLRTTPGIAQVLPDYLGRNLRVEFDPQQTTTPQILQAIEASGFPAQVALPVHRDSSKGIAEEQWHRGLRLGTYFGGLLLLGAALARLAMGSIDWPVAVLAIASTVASGWPVARAAYRAYTLRTSDMNVLMTIAGIGAIAIGDFFEAATAMFLFGVSLWLERLSLRRAQRGIRSLMELAPKVAHRITSPGTAVESVEDVEPDQLCIGNHVLIRPGERIPTDGQVICGESAVNQAPITGESLPVEKKPGDRLFAGTLNGEGSLVIAVTKAAGDTTLAQIERLIEDARARRSPTERFVDAFARRYTPTVIVLAVAIAVVPTLLAHFGVAWAASVGPVQWLERGLVLLVIACPCALVISTPVTIVSAVSSHAAWHFGERRRIFGKSGGGASRGARQDRHGHNRRDGSGGRGNIQRSIAGQRVGNCRSLGTQQRTSSGRGHCFCCPAKRDRGIGPQHLLRLNVDWAFMAILTAKRTSSVRPKIVLPTHAFELADDDLQRLRPPALAMLASKTAMVSMATAPHCLVGTADRLLGVIVWPTIHAVAAEAIADLRQLGVRRDR